MAKLQFGLVTGGGKAGFGGFGFGAKPAVVEVQPDGRLVVVAETKQFEGLPSHRGGVDGGEIYAIMIGDIG